MTFLDSRDDLVFVDGMAIPFPSAEGYAHLTSEFIPWFVKPVNSRMGPPLVLKGASYTPLDPSAELPGFYELPKDCYKMGTAGVVSLFENNQGVPFLLSPQLVVSPSLFDRQDHEHLVIALGRLALGLQDYLATPFSVNTESDFESFIKDKTFSELDDLHSIRDFIDRAASVLNNLLREPPSEVSLGLTVSDSTSVLRGSTSPRARQCAQTQRYVLHYSRVVDRDQSAIESIKSLIQRAQWLLSTLDPRPMTSSESIAVAGRRSTISGSTSIPQLLRASPKGFGQGPSSYGPSPVLLRKEVLELRRQLDLAVKERPSWSLVSSDTPSGPRNSHYRTSEMFETWCTLAVVTGLKARGFTFLEERSDLARFIFDRTRDSSNKQVRDLLRSRRNLQPDNQPHFVFRKQVAEREDLFVKLQHEPRISTNRLNQEGEPIDVTPDLVIDAQIETRSSDGSTSASRRRRFILDAKYHDFSIPAESGESRQTYFLNLVSKQYSTLIDVTAVGLLHPNTSFSHWLFHRPGETFFRHSKPDEVNRPVSRAVSLFSCPLKPSLERESISKLFEFLFGRHLDLQALKW